MPLSRHSNRSGNANQEEKKFIISPSRFVTVLYVMLFLTTIVMGTSFIVRKRRTMVRLARKNEELAHGKETGEFKDALLTVGMAIQSELRHFHIGSHLANGLKSRFLDRMGQLDIELGNATKLAKKADSKNAENQFKQVGMVASPYEPFFTECSLH